MQEELGLNWDDFFQLHAGRGKYSLRQTIHDLALKGNVTLLKHLGETVLGQTTKITMEHTGSGGKDLNFRGVSDEELNDKLQVALKNLSVVKGDG